MHCGWAGSETPFVLLQAHLVKCHKCSEHSWLKHDRRSMRYWGYIRVMVHGNEILNVLFLQMFKSSYFLFPDHNFSLNSNVQVASLSSLGWSRHFWDTFHGISGLTVFELVCINFIRIRNGKLQYFWAEHETRTWWAFQKETCWV